MSKEVMLPEPDGAMAPTERSVSADGWAIAERVMIQGDLSRLTPQERVSLYRETCLSLGLNPLTRPFDYITLNGKLTLYAKRDCTDQLRALHSVSVAIVGRELAGDVYTVTARASLPNGRCDESIGAVAVAGLKGDGLANAYMKAETKAKRRATLSLVGLGWLDESEAASVPNSRVVAVSSETGEVLDGKVGVTINGCEPDLRREKLRVLWEKMRGRASEWNVAVSPFPEELDTALIGEAWERIAPDVARQIEERKAQRDAEPVAVAAEEIDPFETADE